MYLLFWTFLVDSGVDSELDESVIVDDQYNRILTSAKDSILSTDFSNSTPLLPGEELGPMPSNKEIFGKAIDIFHSQINSYSSYSSNRQNYTNSSETSSRDARI